MNAVGDRVYLVIGKHQTRYFSMSLGHTVDVVAEIQRQIGHVKHPIVAEYVFHQAYLITPQHMHGHIQWEAVVPGGYRRMRGEDTLSPHRLDIVTGDHVPAGLACGFAQKLKCQQSGVPFVHVKRTDVMVPQCTKHPDATDAQHYLLT